ncbi:hypothetical protein [Hydrogenophaga sp.]|uniref:hypothetical protein n=1 Tax=Hydrogenophaga sp. TaxID=1904254 RepID=UPI003568BDB8
MARALTAQGSQGGQAAWLQEVLAFVLAKGNGTAADRSGTEQPTPGRDLVRAHPLACVLGAASLGAVLVAVRPWRWVAVRRQASLAQSLAINWAVANAVHLPWRSWLSAIQTPPVQAGRGVGEAADQPGGAATTERERAP